MSSQLLNQILRCDRLPSFPAIAVRVIELCSEPDVSVRELGEVLSHDTAMSTKILRTVNSSYYGLRNRVTTVERATAMLGISAVKMLALGFSLVPQLKTLDGAGFDPTIIWRRSLYAAVGAHTIARNARIDHHDEAFIAGLLQDLGVFVMLQTLREKYVEVVKTAIHVHPKLRAAEYRAFELDHTKVGQALAEKWILPEILATVIRFHETPNKVVDEYQSLTRAVALGAKAADCFLSEPENCSDNLQSYVRSAKAWFRLDQEAALSYLEEIQKGTRELGKLFEIDSQTELSAEELMERANQALVNLSVQTVQHTQTLEAQNRQLSDQAHHDALTGVYNRSGLDQALDTAFAHAVHTKSHLAVAFMDLDDFKSINDTHGHQAGDSMLRYVASVMSEFAPENASVGRYGGDEFVMVLPGIDGASAAAIAEKVRTQTCQANVNVLEGVCVSTTMSIGIAVIAGFGAVGCDPEQLVCAADKAMYAAKQAGGNRTYHLPPIDQPVSKAG